MSVPPTLYIASFGFVHRTPPAANAVIDVRWTPNPSHVAEFRRLSGRDKPVQRWLINHPYVAEWFETLVIVLGAQLDTAEKKHSHAVSWVFGCTNGHDRSVAVAEYTAATVRRTGLIVRVDHLDIHHQNDDEPGQQRRP
jgi:RNase adapter protein RapZ